MGAQLGLSMFGVRAGRGMCCDVSLADGENGVRVRLNRASGQSPRSTAFSAFLDAKAKEIESEAEPTIFGTTEPYYLYPLPQRLEDMVCLAPADTPLLPLSTRTGRANLREPDMAAR